jgi:hypothetical protein
MGAFQVTANRALFSNLRNASGTEVGTSSTPLQVTGANGSFPLAAGSAIIGKVDIDQTTPGTTNGVQANIASGGVASGAFAAGAGADGWNVTEGTKADSAWSGSGSGSIVAILKAIYGLVNAPPPLGTTAGWTPKSLTAITNSAQTVKSSAGQLGYAQCDNNNAAWTYLQLLDATSPTLGTNVGFIPLPPNLSAGMTLSVQGLQFANAIKVGATTTPGGSTAPGTSVNCSFGYN